MSLLDQLWDDTVAGPRPENGLGKLRKHPTFTFRSNSGKDMETDVRSNGGNSVDDGNKVTRSIMIIKPRGGGGGGGGGVNGSPPISPAGSSTPPLSPFGGGRESNRFRRRFPSDAYEQQQQQQQRSPAAASAILGENDGFRCPTSPYDM